MRTTVWPDWIGHGAKYEDDFARRNIKDAQWGIRRIGGRLDDVTAYWSEEAAIKARDGGQEFDLPPLEVVRRVDGVWCNIW